MLPAEVHANDNYALTASLLGGKKVLRSVPNGPAETHQLIKDGLPGKALKQLFSGLTAIKQTDALEKGVGISLRTYQRSQKTSSRPLNVEQSSRAWVFASILAQAIRVLGDRAEAEDWLQRPAYALNQQKPIDLLSTPAGVDMVRTLLGRIEYGVYT
jgi:putative toxin-antitoxin system antitoxin component (TIGR02293 family)